MATNISSATYPSPCAHREMVLHTSLLTMHHLLHICLYVPHTVLDTASGKAGCDFGGLYLALNLRLTPVQMWDLLLLGRCHALKLSSGSLSPNYPSGLFETHYTLHQRKEVRDKASGS